MEALIKAAEQQKLRQLKKLVQLKRQAEQQLRLQRERESKQEMHEARERLRTLEAQKHDEGFAVHRAQAEARRQAARLAAEAKSHEVRAAAEAKLAMAEERSRMHQVQQEIAHEITFQRREVNKERRRQIKLRSEHQQLEQQGQYLSKLEAVEKTLRRKQVQTELERRQRSIQEAEKEVKRREAAKRAEIEQATKAAYYERRMAAKEAVILERRMQQELELENKMKQSQLKSTLVRDHVQEARSADDRERHELALKISEKMMRSDIMEEQRQHLLEQMQLVRKEMAMQEAKLKEAFDKMTRTGRLDLPPELKDLERSGLLDFYPATPTTAPVASRTQPLPCQPASPRVASGRPSSAQPLSSTCPRPFRPKSSHDQRAKHADADGFVSPSPTRHMTEDPSTSARPAEMTDMERELKAVLEEEQRREAERETLMSQVVNPVERQRLLKVYAYERELAKKRILSLGMGVL